MKTIEELLKELEGVAEKLSSTKHLPIDSLHMAVGLSSEVGELLGIEKKAYFQNHPIDELGVKLEVGDILFYLLGYLRDRGYPLRECLIAVLAKLEYRYPSGKFDEEASVNRSTEAERFAATYAIGGDRIERREA